MAAVSNAELYGRPEARRYGSSVRCTPFEARPHSPGDELTQAV